MTNQSSLGKDMTFRDYAQGSFRMRQIGKGQNITVFVTPEVSERVKEDLGVQKTNQPHLDIIAWLILNSMKAAALQSIKLDEQELQNIWRKVLCDAMMMTTIRLVFVILLTK